MASVGTIQRNMQTNFKIELIGDNLPNNHMAKIIKWTVNDFKKKYPLLFTREYNGGRRPKYGWDELLAFEIYSVYSNKRTLRKRVEWISDNIILRIMNCWNLKILNSITVKLKFWILMMLKSLKMK